MRKWTLLHCGVIFASSVGLLNSIFAASAFADSRRDDLIRQNLDCVSKAMSQEMDWGEVCSLDASPSYYDQRRAIEVNAALDRAEHVQEKSADQGRDPVAPVMPMRSTVKIPESSGLDSNERERFLNPQTRWESETLEKKPIKPESKIRKTLRDFLEKGNPNSIFEVGFDVMKYNYSHDGNNNYTYSSDRGSVENTGVLAGLATSYIYRTRKNKVLTSWRDVIHDENKINMFRGDVRFSIGNVDYSSDLGQEKDGIHHYEIELRGLIGYDMRFTPHLTLTPYGGFGFRYLNEDQARGLSHVTDQNNGQIDYERELRMFYLPIGFETRAEVSQGLALEFSLEYDYFLTGTHELHYEDAGLFIQSDSSSTYYQVETLANEQEDGYGLRGSAKLIKDVNSFEIFMEPYVRYWHLEDSEPYQWNSPGVNWWWSSVQPWKPLNARVLENDTTEYGVKLGFRY